MCAAREHRRCELHRLSGRVLAPVLLRESTPWSLCRPDVFGYRGAVADARLGLA